MADTLLADVQDQVQKYWAPMFQKALGAKARLASVVNRAYEGEIKRQGDTVRVSQVADAVGENKTVGTNAHLFTPEAISTTYVDVVASRRAVASFKVEDLISLQSQLDTADSKLRRSLENGVINQMNSYLYTLVAPSAAAPDHDVPSTATMDAAQLIAARTMASTANWSDEEPWYAFLDPTYYGNVLSSTPATSADYGASDAPVIGGRIALPRYGFNVVEDNTAGFRLNVCGGASASGGALFFHPDFMYLVQQTTPTVKISDLHPTGEFGYMISVDIVYGAVIGIDGAKKHIRVKAAA